MTLNYS